MKGKSHKSVVKSEHWYEDTTLPIEFNDKDEEPIEHSNSITLNDFLKVNPKKKCVKGRRGKLWKDFSLTKLDKQDEEEIIDLEKESKTYFQPSKCDSNENQDINFQFSIPPSSSGNLSSLLLDCLEENIDIIASKSNPVWYLLDFSHILFEKSKESGIERNLPKHLRFLFLTTFENETNGNISMKMKLFTNCHVNDGLSRFEKFTNNIKEALIVVVNYIFQWLKTGKTFENKKLRNISKNSRERERELLANCYEDIMNFQKSHYVDDIHLLYLRKLWKEERKEMIEPENALIKVYNWQIDCSICFEQFDISKGFSLTCSHWFCCDCWKKYLSAFNHHFTNCPTEGCNIRVSLTIYLVCLDFKMFINSESRLMEQKMQNDSWMYCRNLKCKRVLSVRKGYESMILCQCSDSWCHNCNKQSHWPSTCEQYQYYSSMKSSIEEIRAGDKLVENEFAIGIKIDDLTEKSQVSSITKNVSYISKMAEKLLDEWEESFTGRMSIRNQKKNKKYLTMVGNDYSPQVDNPQGMGLSDEIRKVDVDADIRNI
ncbi:DgyrCDS14915 [Dimorphilus gyrociliatus]|uniref:DgyrCDS14915 n=1 Tax=Dimorphilus gyrociliatus TaxID=2664684 RepID=A0A7I8WFB5_9ANNE|nr:DgyrCDS14915 [Dimorphilus gyrociliatus]